MPIYDVLFVLSFMRVKQLYPDILITLSPFATRVLTQLQLQSTDPSRGAGGHPDSIIRNFYTAALSIINDTQGYRYRNLIETIHRFRPDMNETHFVNLWFRSIQYSFRQSQDIRYLSFTSSDWYDYLLAASDETFQGIQDVLRTQNTATHVIQRYRSLATAMRLCANTNMHLHVVDIGCSLGLGFKSCFANNSLNNPLFTDDTPDQLLLTTLPLALPASQGLGIDIKIPDLAWVKACNYPSRYDADGQTLDLALSRLSDLDIPLRQLDILDPLTPSLIVSEFGLQDIAHSSMTMYELSSQEQTVALTHISRCLKPQGVFIEFTFIDPKDWFQGIHTLIRTNQSGTLSSPLEWLRWSDSRCTHVTPGKDFDKATKFLC